MNSRKNIEKTPYGSWRVRVMKARVKHDRSFPTLQLARLWRDYIKQSKVV